MILLENKPEWLDEVPKLPKGFKWSDGRKFVYKGGKQRRTKAETHVFLPIGNDLYIKDLLNHTCAYGYLDDNGKAVFKQDDLTKELVCFHLTDRTICVIRNWKSLFASEVIMGLDEIMTPFLKTAILTMWKDYGVKLGWTVPILRDLN